MTRFFLPSGQLGQVQSTCILCILPSGDDRDVTHRVSTPQRQGAGAEDWERTSWKLQKEEKEKKTPKKPT